MDMIKIGKFLSELRREHNLTQEQLGEEIGVTNKTISRWETGTYLPPVEMLQLLSEKYGVSINEILSGERLDDKSYRVKAESNIKTALKKSAFTLKDEEKYFSKKWDKDHRFELIVEMIALIAITVLGALFCEPVTVGAVILSIVWVWTVHNRKRAYIERHLYDGLSDETDGDKSSGTDNE